LLEENRRASADTHASPTTSEVHDRSSRFSLDLVRDADRSKPNNVLVQEAFEGDVRQRADRTLSPASAICWSSALARSWPQTSRPLNGDYKLSLGQRLPHQHQ
jgi:hypothetical protein